MITELDWNAVPVGLLVTNQAGQILKYNAFAHRIGIPLKTQNGDAEFHPLQEFIEKATAAGQPRQAKWSCADQHYRLDSIPCESNTLLITITDITPETVELHRQMETMRFVSHELKAPIGAISGYLDLILEGVVADPEKQGGLLEKSRNRAEQLLAFIGDVLNMARSQTQPKQVEPVNLDEILCETLDFFQMEFEKKQQTVQSEIETDIWLNGNAEELSRICTNLISNAVKYTPPGGRLFVNLARNKQHAELVVRDTGIGIPAADLEKLFSQFFRASNAVQQKQPGTGLGLAITKTLVEKHGGTITVNSKENHGATFIITLPILETREL